MRLIIKVFSLLVFISSFSQNPSNQEKIKNSIDAYFYYDREIIHVQFNKNIYVNNEDLAFKGYVWSRNNNTPHFNTTNVQLVIYNEKQEVVQKQLLFTKNGVFTGGIHLSNKFKTGKYYFRFHTNWMNNFQEDDSFTEIIEIINKNDSYEFKTNEPNWKTATINLFPEGGSIINEVNNAIGVTIKDCNKKGIEIKNGIVIDSQSNEVANFHTNKMGNGVFYFIPKLNETYTLKIKSEKLTISEILPKVQETGIIATYNNNVANNKLIIAVKTNEKGVQFYQNKKFTLLIQQNKNLIQQEITFNNNETQQTLLLDKKYLSIGINSIRLIDENLNEITERLIYIYPTSSPITTIEAKTSINDSIALSGKLEIGKANLSISVLPEKNICIDQKNAIQGTFYLNAYLQNTQKDNYTYFDPENVNRKQDMELLMLNQPRSKFLWKNIQFSPPKINFTFDKGVTISGKIDKATNPDKKYKISLVSLKENIFDQAFIDQNNDFKFENFFAQDSTVFILQMINEKNVALATKMEARISSNQRLFSLPLQVDKTICPSEKKADKGFTFVNSKFNDSIFNLKEVVVKSESKKNMLVHKKDMSGFATGYKVKEGDFGKFIDFLGRNGYRTGVDPENGDVFIRSSRLGISAVTPSIFIDNDIVFDNNLLFNLFMNEIDEIYIDQSGSSDTYSMGNGTIKVFLKKDISKKRYFNVKHSSLIVTKGFTKDIEYKNSQFETPNEYSYFGTMNWSPVLPIKENSSFEIKFPKGNQKEIQVLLEGFSDDGQLISEMKKISVLKS